MLRLPIPIQITAAHEVGPKVPNVVTCPTLAR